MAPAQADPAVRGPSQRERRCVQYMIVQRAQFYLLYYYIHYAYCSLPRAGDPERLGNIVVQQVQYNTIHTLIYYINKRNAISRRAQEILDGSAM